MHAHLPATPKQDSCASPPAPGCTALAGELPLKLSVFHSAAELGGTGGNAGCGLCPTTTQRPPTPAALSSAPDAAAADTHSSGLVQHQLLNRADDGGSGRGHGSSQWRTPLQGTRPPPRSGQLRDRLWRPREETPHTQHTGSRREKQCRGANPLAARGCWVLPDSPSPASQQAPPRHEGRGYRNTASLRADVKGDIFVKGRRGPGWRRWGIWFIFSLRRSGDWVLFLVFCQGSLFEVASPCCNWSVSSCLLFIFLKPVSWWSFPECL